jgi:thiol-disulfide isomerase/thioredoxin
MSVLTAAVLVVGLASAFNLLLTFGVIRRLREHSELLGSKTGAPEFTGPPGTVRGSGPGPAVGTTVESFTARTVDDVQITRDSLVDGTLVGFFNHGCEPCAQLLPEFVAYAAQRPGGRQRVLAVVSTQPESDHAEVRAIVAQLGAVAQVLDGPQGETVTTAFGVRGWPALVEIDAGGTVTAAEPTLTNLRRRAEAHGGIAGPELVRG